MKPEMHRKEAVMDTPGIDPGLQTERQKDKEAEQGKSCKQDQVFPPGRFPRDGRLAEIFNNSDYERQTKGHCQNKQDPPLTEPL